MIRPVLKIYHGGKKVGSNLSKEDFRVKGKNCRSVAFFFFLCRLLESEFPKFSRVQLFVTSWTIAHQAPPSMGFSRQEYWSGLPFPSPGIPQPGAKPRPGTESTAF